jgi:hypothetical protein
LRFGLKNVEMRKLIVAAALAVLFASTPALATDDPLNRQALESCVFRAYLNAAHNDIIPEPTGWSDLAVIWDLITPDWFSRLGLKSKYEIAETRYESSMEAVASEGEAWFGMPRKMTEKLLSPWNHPEVLKTVINHMIRDKTGACHE